MGNKIGVIDEPAPGGGDDDLDIGIHSKSLIEFIQKTETPITVGIQGVWGSGKTSLLYSIYHTFETEQPTTFKQIWINSWEYSLLSTPEEALLKIVKSIIDPLCEHDLLTSDTGKRYKQQITDISKSIFKGALRIGAQVALGDEAAKVADELVASGGHSISELRKKLDGLVDEMTKEPNNLKKIIIYVDDLDRIEPKNAVAILELMKNIFNVRNCVFILAIDFQVVVKGLEDKFGPETHENEWEFRAFFDKIIQLPFKMPMSQYNIGKYINKLLKDIGFFEDVDFDTDTDAIKKIIMLTIGGNPRSIKRLVNSVSLIQIFVKHKKESKMNDDDNHEKNILSEKQEKFLVFSLLCLQIAYPLVYSLLEEEPDFVNWNDALAFRKTQRSEDNIEAFRDEFDNAQENEDFNDEWEKALYRICYERPLLKSRISDISRFLSYIKDDYLGNSQKPIGKTIAYILTQTSVTSVSSTVQGSAKTGYGKPLIDYVKEISEQIGKEEEITKKELKKRISELTKKESGEDIKPNTLNALLIRATINDNNRWNFYINEKNKEKYNVFYFVDENNKKILKKYLPDSPPNGCKIYYKKKDTNEKCEQIL